MVAPEGCAAISDRNGDILFYTDGRTVYSVVNDVHQQMPNGDNLSGDPGSAQSSIIVQFPSDETLYYIFTTNCTNPLVACTTFQLSYSVVDLKAAVGGDVVIKNKPLFEYSTEKIAATADLDLTWHFIGRIQSNKTRDIATHFHWVQTVDREKIARRLHEHCPNDKRLNILLQVNIDADSAKAGISPAQAGSLLEYIEQLPRLSPRGLMTILAADSDPRASYQSMAQLFKRLKLQLDPDSRAHWDTLSMGMTGDLEHAIAAGATHIRIGTARFGAREASTH